MGPLIPYIQIPELPLTVLLHVPLLGRLFDPASPPSIKPFGTLVAIGVYLGAILAGRRARQRGLDPKITGDLVFWVVVGGFVGGHMLDAIFYHPDRVLRDPLYVLALWDGLSSYGGFIGAGIATVAWGLRRRMPVLPHAEIVGSAFPLGWLFGRMGCASVHDHPGRLSDAWFAVRWPMGSGHVGRLDLGLYEMLLTIPLVLAFAWLWRRKPVRPDGFYLGWMCTLYAPIRFLLDMLREEAGVIAGGDPRYGGLTPAQWACFGLLALGLYFLRRAYRPAPKGPAEAAAAPSQA